MLTPEVDGKSYPAVVKDMQRHPIRRTVAHIDFLQVNMNEEITVSVAVHIIGESKAVAPKAAWSTPLSTPSRSLHAEQHAQRLRDRRHRDAAA